MRRPCGHAAARVGGEVTYVTDTHALVLFASGALADVSLRAARIFRRAEGERDRIHVPVICLFEILILLERRRITMRMDLDEWHALISRFPGLPLEPLGWDDIREARGLARLVDPFDRLIAASAVRLDVPLITGDERIRGSGLVRTVW